MDNVKNDIYFAKSILKNIEVLSRYLRDKSQDDLLNDDDSFPADSRAFDYR